MRLWMVLTAIGIGAFLGVIVVCGGLSYAFFQLMEEEIAAAAAFGEVAGIDSILSGPPEGRVGEAVIVTVSITNTGATTKTIYSLDVYTDLVDQSPIEATPAPRSVEQLAANQYAELVYGLPLPPGETREFEITFVPLRAEQYAINIDACIDGPFDYVERFHFLNVLPGDAEEADGDH